MLGGTLRRWVRVAAGPRDLDGEGVDTGARYLEDDWTGDFEKSRSGDTNPHICAASEALTFVVRYPRACFWVRNTTFALCASTSRRLVGAGKETTGLGESSISRFRGHFRVWYTSQYSLRQIWMAAAHDFALRQHPFEKPSTCSRALRLSRC
jgi:hypothetical protein